jgi:hypothetical protein
LLLYDLIQSELQLRPAVAPQTVKNISSQTLRMDAHQRRTRYRRKIADLKSDCFLGADGPDTFEAENSELPKSAGKIRFGNFSECEVGLGQ